MDPLAQILTRLKKIKDTEEKRLGKNSFELLDILLDNFSHAGLYCIASARQTDKTPFIISLMNSLESLKNMQSIGVVSPDIPAYCWMECYLSNISELWYEKIRRGRLEEHEAQRLFHRQHLHLCSRIQTHSPGFPKKDDLVEQLYSWKTEHSVRIVFVDGIQNLLETRNVSDNIRDSFALLKQVSHELDIPIVATYDYEGDGDTPTNDPARSFADVWMTLQRTKSIEETDMALQKEMAHLRVLQNKFGALETLSFRPMLHIQKFSEWDF